VTSEVRHRVHERVDRVAELAETTVAVEAQDPAHGAAVVGVIDVLGRFPAADRAHATLLRDQRIEVVRADAVTPLQVRVPTPAAETRRRLFVARVVAGLAIRMAAVQVVLVTRKLLFGPPLATIRAPISSAHSTGTVLGFGSLRTPRS
jgi:hypothetical protein